MSGRRNKASKGVRQEPKAEPARAAKAAEAEADDDDDDDEDEDDDEAEAEAQAPAAGSGKKPAPKLSAGPPRDLRGMVDGLLDKRWFQLGLATFLACIHLFMFAQAGHSRLGLPFNDAPGEELVFNDLHAPATRGQPRQPTHWSRLIVSRFDAQHYEGTAVRGLTACPTDASTATGGQYLDCGLGWLPAYGWVGGAVSAVTGFEPDYALVLTSVLCAIVLNMLWVSRTMVKRLGKFEAYAVLIAWNFYPDAFYLVTPLVEAAVMALAIGGFIALCNERWVLSAFLIGACTALRMPTAAFAIALGCTLLFVAWQRREAKTPQWWRPLLGLPLCGWGQFLTMLVLQVRLGNWLAFFSARKAFGDENRSSRLTDPVYLIQGFTAQNMDMVIFVALLAIIALTFRRTIAKFAKPEAMFLVIASVVTIFLVILAPLHWWGITRYMMLCPLAFLGMGIMARAHKGLFVLWFVLCCAFYWHVEICNYITQGDAKVCPCSGRTELHMPFAS